MNGSADEADVLSFLAVGSGYGGCSGGGSGTGTGTGTGSGYGLGISEDYGLGYGAGSGSGDGYGYGYGQSTGRGYGGGYVEGFGDGDGSSDGCGHGGGYGYGYGYGYGDGEDFGIKVFNGQKVFCIDYMATIVLSVHGPYARGYILSSDLTLKPTYIARVNGFFAHGDTLHKAREDAFAKYMEHRSVEQRIAEFIKAHPDRNIKYAGEDLYSWHGILTGSCRAGRDAWCEGAGLDPKTAKLTVAEFCRLTRDAYGGYVIRQLEKTMEVKVR